MGACESRQGSAPPPRDNVEGYRLDLAAVAAGREPALLTALKMPRGEIHRRLGVHRAALRSTIVLESSARKTTLKQELTLAVAKGGAYQIVKHTSPQYGVELRWIGGKLYPRQRFSKFYARVPRDRQEPAQLAERLGGLLPAYVRLLERFVKPTLVKRETFAGRSALRVRLEARVKPRPLAPTRRSRSGRARVASKARAWRRSVAVESLAGSVLLDAKTGAPLSAKLDARWTFVEPAGTRLPKSGIPETLGDTRGKAALSFEEKATLGGAVTVTPPPAKDLIDVRRRRLEVERQIVEGERPLPKGWRRRFGDIQR